jgi:hypothetical protein
MSLFNIRVWLHEAPDSKSYSILAERLRLVGITDIIVANDQTRFKLPPGEYSFSSKSPLDQVLQLIKTSVVPLGLKYSVRVTDGDSAWYNLAPA